MNAIEMPFLAARPAVIPGSRAAAGEAAEPEREDFAGLIVEADAAEPPSPEIAAEPEDTAAELPVEMPAASPPPAAEAAAPPPLQEARRALDTGPRQTAAAGAAEAAWTAQPEDAGTRRGSAAARDPEPAGHHGEARERRSQASAPRQPPAGAGPAATVDGARAPAGDAGKPPAGAAAAGVLSAALGEGEAGWRLGAAPAADGARSAVAAPLPPTTVHAVGRQVALAIGRADGDCIEIRLDPPELGRVQIEMRAHDGALQAVLTAERPEIVELMRRHAEALQRELEAAGYAGVTLDFAAGSENGRDGAGEPPGLAAAPAADLPAAPRPEAPADGRLDVRL